MTPLQFVLTDVSEELFGSIFSVHEVPLSLLGFSEL
jgi:hypothetical protein